MKLGEDIEATGSSAEIYRARGLGTGVVFDLLARVKDQLSGTSGTEAFSVS